MSDEVYLDEITIPPRNHTAVRLPSGQCGWIPNEQVARFLAEVPGGSVIELRKTSGPMVAVALPDGRRGYIPESEIDRFRIDYSEGMVIW